MSNNPNQINASQSGYFHHPITNPWIPRQSYERYGKPDCECGEGKYNPECKKCCVTNCPPKCCPPKDPCPLKPFCDPNLKNSCLGKPVINNCLPRRSVTTWKTNYLVSNQMNQAAHIDPDLINPWGIVIFNNQIWNVNGGTDSLTNYDLFGNKLLATRTVRDPDNKSSYPSGIAINCSGNFLTTSVTTGAKGAATFLIATEHSTVHTYTPTIDTAGNIPLVINTKPAGVVSIFRGIALHDSIMYLAELLHSRIDVYDAAYNPLTGFNFVDNDTTIPIPSDYGPNNIVRIGNHLFVAYSRKNPNILVQAIKGAGYGFVSIFNFDGSFVRRFTSKGVLNDPWAIIPAPCECGFPPGSILIGNHGDGRINVFDCEGRFVGPFLNQSGLPLVIEGLRGLAPHYTNFNEIYFTASYNDLTQGVLGSIIKSQVILV